MGILSGIFKSRDKPQNATSGSAYRFFTGGSSSGKNVNERSAMQMTAVYSCVRILSEAVASLPLHVYKYNGDGGKEKAVKHPLYFLLHDEPNPEMTSFVFRETLMTHLLLWGNAYAQIIRNGKGEIIALYPLMPNRMTVDRDDKGQLYYQYNTSKDDAPTMKGSMVNLKPSDVLHIPVDKVQIATFLFRNTIKVFKFSDIVSTHPTVLSANGISIHTALIITTEQAVHIELDKVLCFFIRRK